MCVEYEFTGEEIIERRGGHIKNQMRISDIIETKTKISPPQLILKTNNSRMTVQILPSLNEVIKKESAEIMANKSESERQQFEEVKKETISRLKRVNVIGSVILILVMIALVLLIGWLKRRH
jgi:Pyruvate/2-oxoacid:ferredoxin oxidoreductase gamma subunit